MKKRKKIAVFSLGRKGAGPLIGLRIARELWRTMDVLLVYSKQSEIRDMNSDSKFTSICIDTFKTKGEILKSLVFPKWIITVIGIIKNNDIDVILWPMLHPWTAVINVLLFKKVKIISAIHDVIPHKGDTYLLYIMNRIAMHTSNKIILFSNKSKKQIKNIKLMRKSTSIPLGVYGIDEQHNHKAFIDRKTVLYFGRIEPYKDIDVLLDMFDIIHDSDNEIKLIIAGKGDVSHWKNRIQSNKSIELINRWIDNKELSGLFRKSTVVVLPYKEATQSGIIPFAYEFNVPVIASNCGAISEQIVNGETGYLINKGNVDEFACKVLNLLQNKELIMNMKKNIMDYKRKYSWNNIIKRYERIINE